MNGTTVSFLDKMNMTEKGFVEGCGQKLSWFCSYMINVAKKQEELAELTESNLSYGKEIREAVRNGKTNRCLFKSARFSRC